MEKSRNYYLPHLIFLLVYALGNAFMWLIRDNGGSYVFLVWNVFLAFLPVLFARWFSFNYDGRRAAAILAGFLWLIFWPNTFYMVTDAIHFSGDTFREIIWGIPAVTPNQVVYSTDLLLWLKLLLIMAGILYAIMNGIHSQNDVEAVILTQYGQRSARLFRLICAALGGVAIYLGRFLRVNSWDILSPSKIFSVFLSLGHDWWFVGGFIGLFAAFIWGSLCFYEQFSLARQ